MAYLAMSTRRCGRGTSAAVVTTMTVDFNGVMVAPLPATPGGANHPHPAAATHRAVPTGATPTPLVFTELELKKGPRRSLNGPTTNHNVQPPQPTPSPTPWSEPLPSVRGWWNMIVQPFLSRFIAVFQPFLNRS
jgi:hypothetical protein